MAWLNGLGEETAPPARTIGCEAASWGSRVVETFNGVIAAMCPAESTRMNSIILKEGLYTSGLRITPRLLLLVIGTANL
jgi:hypothetical protein